MAEGFLVRPKGYDEMEETGNEYFGDLVSRSFFQRSSGYLPSFIMHDLINDLARSVSGGFCMHLEDGDPRKSQRGTRYLTYREIKEASFQSFEGSCAPQSLHTLMRLELLSSGTQKHEEICSLWPTLERLRVLSIAEYSDMSVLSDSIGNLKHLRYLDLSGANITRLPESVCSLHNLEILILNRCGSLVELPANIVSLISLRHLDIRWTSLQEMPPQMGKLTKLRMLSDFYVGKHSGCGIKELGELQHLRGRLSIRNLQHVMDAQDALEANLKGKEHLEELGLFWGNIDNSQVQEGVLEQLQPHKNTKGLAIDGYGGTRFPEWIGDSSLPLLQRLHIRSCPNLKKALFTHFPSLTGLHIEGCEQLEIECNPLESFPKLESLAIHNCLNISFSIGALYSVPNMTEFYLTSCSHLKSLPQHMHSVLPSLTTLSISWCPELESFPEGGLPSQLQNLWIDGCNKLIANRMQWDLQSLPSLSHIQIGYCEDVVSFPEETLLPSTLTSLGISGLENLKSLEYRGLHHLTSLRELHIWKCRNLQSMPEEGLPSSLAYLAIVGCPLLEKKCEKEIGEYWPKISHIPNIKIDWKKIN